MMIAGLNGGRDGAAALADGGRLVGVCAQERVTRVRGAGSLPGWPAEALDLLLQRRGRSRADLGRSVAVDVPAGAQPAGPAAESRLACWKKNFPPRRAAWSACA